MWRLNYNFKSHFTMKNQFDVICFHEDCINQKTQLFYSGDTESEFHYQKKHQTVPIHKGSPFFMNLKMPESELKMTQESALSIVRKKYEEKKTQIIRLLDAHFIKTENNILNLYQIGRQPIQFKDFWSNLTEKTSLTDLYLPLTNWLFRNNSSEKYFQLKDYLNQAIQTRITQQEDMFDKIKKDIIKANEFHGQLPKPNPSLHRIKSDPGMLNHQINVENIRRLDQKIEQNHNSQQKARKYIRFEKNPDFIIQVGKEMIQLAGRRQKIGYRTINQQLKLKLGGSKPLDNYLRHIFDVIFKQIEENVITKLGFKKIPKVHKVLILPDFKHYQRWFRRQDTQVMTNCIKFFFDIEKDKNVAFYQIYVMYVNFVISIRKNLLNKKKGAINYNSQPMNIRSQIAYLYFHYSNIKFVAELLTEKYHLSSRYKDTESIIEEFKQLLKQTLKKMGIKDSNQFIHNLLAEYEHPNEKWLEVREKIIQFFILNESGQESNVQQNLKIKEQLESLIKQITEQKNVMEFMKTIKNKSGKNQEQSIVVVDEQEISTQIRYSGTKKTKLEVISNTKVAKLELPDSESEYAQE